MQRILEELFFGNINPNERKFDRKSEYAKYLNTISNNEEKLTLLLNREEKDLFLGFVNAQSSVNAITAMENFILGFKLGARIGIEVMNGEDGLLQETI